MWKIPLYTKWLRFATKLPGDLLQWRVRRKKRDFRASKRLYDLRGSGSPSLLKFIYRKILILVRDLKLNSSYPATLNHDSAPARVP